jgi:hypothetical protein
VQAIRTSQPWTRHLPPRPQGPAEREWRDVVITVAAYRDRYAVTADSLLGDQPSTLTQRDDAHRVRARMQGLANVSQTSTSRGVSKRTAGPGLGPS